MGEVTIADHGGTETEPAAAISEHKFRVAEVVAEQIWREQQLVTARMTWLLTFQGFLLTAFAWTYGADAPARTKIILQSGLIVTGFLIPIATYCSIYASQLQRDHMKTKWSYLYGESEGAYDYPRPYSST